MSLIKKNKNIFIIAEVAQAHDGSLSLAHSFIDAVADAGADAIKFQAHFADYESTYDEKWRIKFSKKDKKRYDYWQRLEFSFSEWQSLFNHAKKRNLEFICSPFSVYAAQILKKIGIKYWKIASGEFFNSELLKFCFSDKKPMLISTGMANTSEINAIYKKLIKIKKEFYFFHCLSMYPTPPEYWNLSKITEMKKKYKIPIGFSDHSGDIYSGLAATALGAELIEVHVTFDKKIQGPDTSSSLDFNQLKNLVLGCKNINKSFNNKKNNYSKSISKTKKLFTRSLALKSPLKKGEIIKKENITLKKPGSGIPSSFLKKVVGKKMKKNKSNRYLLQFSDFK